MSDAKRLLEQATPLPWATTPHDDGADVYAMRMTRDGVPVLDGVLAEFLGAPNAVLAVYAANRLPDYEAAVDALEALADAATALENRAIRSGGEFHVWAEERMVTEVRDEARAILRRLRESVAA
jgi:hypothetical protein